MSDLRDKDWCWIHMDSSCIECEADQLKQIVKKAIGYIQLHGLDPDFNGQVVNNAPSRNRIAEELLRILRTPIKPSAFDSEE